MKLYHGHIMMFLNSMDGCVFSKRVEVVHCYNYAEVNNLLTELVQTGGETVIDV